MANEEIFYETDALFGVLQNKLMDIAFCCAQTRDTIDYVERTRQEFDRFYHRFEQECATLHFTDNGDMCQIKDKRKQTFYNILDDIIFQLKSRFENFSELSFLGLVLIAYHPNLSHKTQTLALPFFDAIPSLMWASRNVMAKTAFSKMF